MTFTPNDDENLLEILGRVGVSTFCNSLETLLRCGLTNR